jgi:hypothetical protein
MDIEIDRTLWDKAGTWNLPGGPQCAGSHVMNAFGYPMRYRKELDNLKWQGICVDKKAEDTLLESFDQICEVNGFDPEFQYKSMELNNSKDEDGLKKLFATRGINVSFV